MQAKTLGIIGGGQLGLYLCEAAHKLGLETRVLTSGPYAPASHRANHLILASLPDEAALEELIDQSDVITFEFEAVPTATLKQLAQAEAEGRVRVNPGVETLSMLQDKGRQKSWLERRGLPTLPFVWGRPGPEEAKAWAEQLGLPFVQKARRGGYDGRGVQIINSLADLDKLWDIPSIAEPFLDGAQEIAVLCARNPSGEVFCYPPIRLEFDPDFNALHQASSPAQLPPQRVREAMALGEEIVKELKGVGLFAVEMFISERGELFVNEISPRVHNAGHLTMDAFRVSQFEQHVRAVTDMPLLFSEQVAPAAMVNILYRAQLRLKCPAEPVHSSGRQADSHIYWYGKEPGQTGRKMGHINCLGNSTATAIERANRIHNGLPLSRGDQAA